EMPVPQGCRPEALVRAGILFVADADVLGIKQPDDRRKDRLPSERPAPEIAVDPPPQPRQRLPELEQSIVFRTFALFAEIGMIAILLAPPRIDSCRLQVAVGVRAKPRLGISRRQGDCVEPVDLGAIGDAISFGIEIAPVSADALARDAGLAVAAVPQHGVLRFTRLIDRPKRAASVRVPVLRENGDADAADARFESADRRYRRFRRMGAVRASRDPAEARRRGRARLVEARSDSGDDP